MRLLAYSVLSSVCALTLLPRAAEATSCGPSIEQLVPLDAELLPVTAKAHATFECDWDLTGWQVDIDGEPAELVYEDPGIGYGIMSMAIVPAPIEGSMVDIRGCMYGCWDEEPEFDVLRGYMVTGEDAEAPATPGLLDLGFSDEIINEYDFDTDTEEMVAVRRWNVHFDAPVLDEPVVWVLTVGPGADVTGRARIMEDGDQDLVITRRVSNAGEEVCATARAHDLSGNISEDVVICMEVGEDQELPPVPGDGEDSGGSDSGDESGDGTGDGTGDGSSGGDDGINGTESGDGGLDDDASGCSCTAGDDGGNPLGLGALLGVFALGLRRRRRR